MKRWAMGLVVLLIAAYAVLWLLTEPRLRPPPSPAFAAPAPGDVATGKRLARVAGCISCHGKDLGGSRFIAEDFVFKLVAPDLTQARHRYDDAALVRLFRSGTKSDGKLAVGMPTEMQQRMTDREAADIIAWLRSVPPSRAPVQERTRIYPLARIGILTGKYEPYGADPPESPAVLADRREPKRGRHLASIACSECHGTDFRGSPDRGTPALAIAKAYSPAQFERLMRTGITLAGTESASGLMSKVARKRFSELDAADISALHDYLSGRAVAAR